MDLATARMRATISVPEAGELLGLGRDAAYAAADRSEIPTLSYGRRRRVPVALLLAQLGEPLEHLRALRPDGAAPDSGEDSDAGVSHAGVGNVLTLTGARRDKDAPHTSG